MKETSIPSPSNVSRDSKSTSCCSIDNVVGVVDDPVATGFVVVLLAFLVSFNN